MSISTRYILARLLRLLLFIIVALSGGLWLTQLLGHLPRLFGSGLPTASILYLMALRMPQALQSTLPVCLAVTVLYTYLRLDQEFELAALWATGLSKWRVARPALILGAALTVVLYGVALFLAPWSSRTFWQAEETVLKSAAAALIDVGTFHALPGGLTVYARDRAPDGRLLGVLIHDERGAAGAVTIIGEESAMVKTEGANHLVVINGTVQAVSPDDGRLSVVEFERFTVDLEPMMGSSARRVPRPYERYLWELFFPEPQAFLNNRPEELLAEAHYRLTRSTVALVVTVLALAPFLGPARGGHTPNSRKIIAFALAFATVVAFDGLKSLVLYALWLTPLLYAFPLAVVLAALAYIRRGEVMRPGTPVNTRIGSS